jgi:hypothetical protein
MLCVICKYDVTINNEYTYLNEEGDFSSDKSVHSKIMDGSELANILANYLSDSNFWQLNKTAEGLYVSLFDPTTGETDEISIIVKEIRDERTQNIDKT